MTPLLFIASYVGVGTLTGFGLAYARGRWLKNPPLDRWKNPKYPPVYLDESLALIISVCWPAYGLLLVVIGGGIGLVKLLVLPGRFFEWLGRRS